MTHYGHTNSQEDSFGTRSTFDLSFGANTSLSGNINYQSSGEFSGAYISGYSSSVSSWDGEASGHSGTIHLSPNNSYNNFVMNNSFNPNNNFSMNNSFNTNNNFNSPTPAFNSNPNNNFGNFNNFNPANTYNFGNNHFGNNYGNNNFNPNPAVNNPNNLPK